VLPCPVVWFLPFRVVFSSSFAVDCAVSRSCSVARVIPLPVVPDDSVLRHLQRDVVFSCVPGNGKFPDFVLLEVLPTSNAPPLKVPQPKRVPKAPSVPKLPPAPVEAAVPAAPVPASRSKEHHQVHKAALAHPSPANPVAAMKREAQAARHPPPTPTPSPLPSYMVGTFSDLLYRFIDSDCVSVPAVWWNATSIPWVHACQWVSPHCG
jgi:hypothetical protein